MMKTAHRKWWLLSLALLVLIGLCFFIPTLSQQDAVADNSLPEPETIVEYTAAMPDFSIEELTERSSLVVLGKVTSISDAFKVRPTNGGDDQIFTYYDVAPIEIFRGDCDGETIRLRLQGGQVGSVLAVTDFEPELQIGEEFIFFLYRPIGGGLTITQDEFYLISGGTQGALKKTTKQNLNDNKLSKSLAAGEEVFYTDAALTEGKKTILQDLDTVVTLESFKAFTADFNEAMPVDEEFRQKEGEDGLKQNLDNGFITQQEYDDALDARENEGYAEIVE